MLMFDIFAVVWSRRPLRRGGGKALELVWRAGRRRAAQKEKIKISRI
jgi:hypothetical protein